jgi:hypothetical protein
MDYLMFIGAVEEQKLMKSSFEGFKALQLWWGANPTVI